MDSLALNLSHPSMKDIPFEHLLEFTDLAEFLNAHPECMEAVMEVEFRFVPDPTLN